MRQGFESFMRKVDDVLVREYRVTHLDIPDVDYWSLYDSGMAPLSVANIAIVNACEEMCIDPSELGIS